MRFVIFEHATFNCEQISAVVLEEDKIYVSHVNDTRTTFSFDSKETAQYAYKDFTRILAGLR